MTIEKTGNVNHYLCCQAILAVAVLMGSVALKAEPPSVDIDEVSYSPYVDVDYPENVYWGDTHLHTSLSVDANISGNIRLSPKEAYRFAKGEVVTAHNGMRAKLSRPLDFIVIADHAFNLGLMPSIRSSDSALLSTMEGKRIYDRFQQIKQNAGQDSQINGSDPSRNKMAIELFEDLMNEEVVKDTGYRHSIWGGVTEEADRTNDPGKFTAFIGFEWSSFGRALDYGNFNGIGNLHRVVIFKDAADLANQVLPFSLIDSPNPEDLWQYMEGYVSRTGGDILAIPHNSNGSQGGMFPLIDFQGQPLSRDYSKLRNRWEPMIEVTQYKGDSEAHPVLSPMDEFANFETWNSFAGRTYVGVKTEGWEKRKASEYARSALKLGLDKQFELGVNPFKFGMIGSTDSHTSLATADDDNFWGKMTFSEPSKGRMLNLLFPGAESDLRSWEMTASGYAAVWAVENTREALFEAMKRKEVYASTGPRMTVRFFGGWDYDKNDAMQPDLARIGYTKGVPMGGDLTYPPKGKHPSFLVRAVRDPDGANLDRVQVIKGWRSIDGELHEKIYNVALSDGRKENKDGKAKPVGSTVNVKEASYTNNIGDPELAVVWTDPDFNEDELAFYYVRVLEIPTPRWTAYDAKFFNIKGIPDEVPMVTQERAYTSPIWYTP